MSLRIRNNLIQMFIFGVFCSQLLSFPRAAQIKSRHGDTTATKALWQHKDLNMNVSFPSHSLIVFQTFKCSPRSSDVCMDMEISFFLPANINRNDVIPTPPSDDKKTACCNESPKNTNFKPDFNEDHMGPSVREPTLFVAA